MFEQSLITEKNGRKPWTVAAAFGLQALLVAAAITLPLLFVQQLPAERFSRLLLAPPPPPPPPPPPAAALRPSRAYQHAAIRTDEPETPKVIPRQFDMSKLTTPRQIPKQIAQIQDAGPPPSAAGVAGGVAGGVPGGVPGGVAGGVIGGVAQGVPPPPPEKPKPDTPKQIRVGGAVQNAKLVRKVVPQYPPIAKQARVQGTVKLRAVVNEQGSVEQLQLISGHPLLAQAAIQAVKQWQYKPTLLNGQPVQVITEIEVAFNLS